MVNYDQAGLYANVEMTCKKIMDDLDELFEEYDRIDHRPRGKRKTGNAYRRKMNRKVFAKKKDIGTYSFYGPWVDWDYDANGNWMPVGKYIKYPKNGDARRYFKNYSNRKLRRSKIDTVPGKGNGYRKQFDYWWTLY